MNRIAFISAFHTVPKFCLLSAPQSTNLILSLPGILATRHKMCLAISTRSHHPIKIFSFGAPSDSEAEIMIYGTVEYGVKAEGDDGKDWAARALLVPGEKGGDESLGGWRLRFYRVYLDTAPKK